MQPPQKTHHTPHQARLATKPKQNDVTIAIASSYIFYYESENPEKDKLLSHPPSSIHEGFWPPPRCVLCRKSRTFCTLLFFI